MHGLDKSEDILCNDMVLVTEGDREGDIGFVVEVVHEFVGQTVESRYAVAFQDDDGYYSLLDVIYGATDTTPPTLSRINDEETSALATTVLDTIG